MTCSMESPSEINGVAQRTRCYASQGRAAGSALQFMVLIPTAFLLIYMSISPARGSRGEAALCVHVCVC